MMGLTLGGPRPARLSETTILENKHLTTQRVFVFQIAVSL